MISDEQVAELVDWTSRAQDVVDALATMLGSVNAGLASAQRPEREETGGTSRRRGAEEPLPVEPTVPRSERPKQQAPLEASAVAAPNLKAGARKMLATLGRQHPIRVSRAQLGTLSGFKHTGGTFGSYLSALRRGDLIDERDGLLGLTEHGMTATDASAEPVGREQILDQYRSVLKAGARAMLDHVVAAHPREVPRDELADATGFAVSGGTFGSYLSTLRRNGLVSTDGDGVALGDVLANA